MTTPTVTWKSGASTAPPPPLVPGKPLLGNVIEFSGDSLEFLLDQYHTYGPIFRVHLLNRTIVVMAGQEANTFMSRVGNEFFSVRGVWDGVNEAMGARSSVISVDGEQHARLRKMLKPGLSHRAIEGRYDEVVAIIRRELAEWPLGESRPGLRLMQRLITEQLGLLMANYSPREYLDDIMHYLRTILMVRVLKRWPEPALWMPGYRRARARVAELSRTVMGWHRANPPGTRPRDLIDDLLDANRDATLMPDEDLLAAVLTPYSAGVDTIATTSSFMLYSLLRQPALLAQVRAEAEGLFANGAPTPEQLRKADLLHRTAIETLRMYPLGAGSIRVAAKPFEFAGYQVEAGQELMPAFAVSHFLPELHPDPFRFDIDRYLPPRNEHRIPGAFAPFSLGSHTCLGAGLAEVQLMLTVATVLRYTRLAVDPPGYQLGITPLPIRIPNNGFRVRLLAKPN